MAYEGPAQDEAAWHAEYLAHHPRLMAALPGIRELEIYLPVDWRCPAHLGRVRSDALPPFSGRVTHYAMITSVLR